jgi:hypothetical protein
VTEDVLLVAPDFGEKTVLGSVAGELGVREGEYLVLGSVPCVSVADRVVAPGRLGGDEELAGL